MRRRFARLLILLAVGFSADAHSKCAEDQPSLEQFRAGDRHTVSAPLTVAELEASHQIKIRETGQVLPFGYANKDWLQFKAAVIPGDSIHFITQATGSFYSDGYALVRNGCVVKFLLGAIS